MMTHNRLYADYKAARQYLLDREAEYRDYCADMAREGFAPEYCRHGTYMWTDFDCVCSACESGDEALTIEAMRIARRAQEHRVEAARDGLTIGGMAHRYPPEVHDLLMQAAEALTDIARG